MSVRAVWASSRKPSPKAPAQLSLRGGRATASSCTPEILKLRNPKSCKESSGEKAHPSTEELRQKAESALQCGTYTPQPYLLLAVQFGLADSKYDDNIAALQSLATPEEKYANALELSGGKAALDRFKTISASALLAQKVGSPGSDSSNRGLDADRKKH